MVIVNLNKYQILLKTVELGSITRAAEALGYTQSAVSRVIADLEREWDMELLTRSRTGVVLSSSGAALLPYVQAVCNAGRELEEQVAELHGLTRGTLRVATFASVSIHWLPAIMKEFLGRYPGIQFDLVSNWEFAEVEDLLRQGQADCGFLGLPAGPGLETYPLFRDELMAVLPLDHPWQRPPTIPWSGSGRIPISTHRRSGIWRSASFSRRRDSGPISVTPSMMTLPHWPWWNRGLG